MEKIKLDTYPQEGTCPICGEQEEIEFNACPVDETGFTYECECQKCGCTWDECYDLVFAGCWNIKDKDGNSYEDLQT